ncbi:carboxypeptidase regulatory-like domain-containing protein [candidate division KSB1 bacterium]|nr:carboxypeptidase regulatory-like domain-containing protein [candidate division KSB1 bacterium]
MKKSIIFFILLLIPVLLTCDKDILDPKSISLATLKGSVVESVLQNPLSGVTVGVSNHTESVQTDSMGQYALEVELETSISSEVVTLTAQKAGYDPFELKDVTVEANKTVEIPKISLDPETYIAQMTGSVVDTGGIALEGVLITVFNHAETSLTDSSGVFSFIVVIDDPVEDVFVGATKAGYGYADPNIDPEKGIMVTLESEETTVVPTVVLKPTSWGKQ